jgi:hypothetical protein
MKTPIAIFTYNRPNQSRQLFNSLLNCTRLEECDVYIFCDGAKKPENVQLVKDSRKVAHEFELSLNAKIIEHDHNIGLAHSVVYGVTKLCQEYGRVIVLEDDLILHPFFLDFMLQSLDRYQDDERVAQIAGFTFPIKVPSTPNTFFLPLTTSWGWATWQRAWDLFSLNLEEALHKLETNPDLCFSFDLEGAYDYSNMLRVTAEGKLDTWDIQWYWYTFSAKKLTLYSCQSLVWQNGFGEAATHTTEAMNWMQPPLTVFMETKANKPISFPEKVMTNEIAFKELKIFLKKGQSFSLINRFRSKLSNIVSGFLLK